MTVKTNEDLTREQKTKTNFSLNKFVSNAMNDEKDTKIREIIKR